MSYRHRLCSHRRRCNRVFVMQPPEIEQPRVDATAFLEVLKDPLRRLFGEATLTHAPDDHRNDGHAAIAIVVRDELKIDPARFNVDGGAIAHGHPISATGAILVTKVAHALKRIGGAQPLGESHECLIAESDAADVRNVGGR
jgi:hypothetical protein